MPRYQRAHADHTVSYTDLASNASVQPQNKFWDEVSASFLRARVDWISLFDFVLVS